MMRFKLLLVALAALVLAGCSSDYAGDYYYSPRPAISEVRGGAATQPAAVATGLAVVTGVRRADEDLGVPRSIEVRMRLDNNGPQEVTFDPASIELSTASLMTFPKPQVRPSEPVNIPQQQSGAFIAWFPFPPGRSEDNMDLSSLLLHWTVRVAGQPVRQDFTFKREYPAHYYYDPYWDYPYWGYPYWAYRGYYGWYGPPPYYYYRPVPQHFRHR